MTSSLFTSQRQLLYHITLSLIRQQLFYFSLIFFLNQCPFFRGEIYNITHNRERQAFFLLFSVFFVYIYFHVFRGYIKRFKAKSSFACFNTTFILIRINPSCMILHMILHELNHNLLNLFCPELASTVVCALQEIQLHFFPTLF